MKDVLYLTIAGAALAVGAIAGMIFMLKVLGVDV